MRHGVRLALLDRIQRNLDSKTSDLGPGGRVAVDVYRSVERLAAEERVLFRRWPIPIAHSSELKTPGSYLTHDHTGVPIVVTRDAEGVVRAFLNVDEQCAAAEAWARYTLTNRMFAWDSALRAVATFRETFAPVAARTAVELYPETAKFFGVRIALGTRAGKTRARNKKAKKTTL